MANSVPAAGANYQASYPLDPRTQAPRKPIPYVKDFFTHLQEAYPWVAIPRFTDTSWWYKNIGRHLFLNCKSLEARNLQFVLRKHPSHCLAKYLFWPFRE